MAPFPRVVRPEQLDDLPPNHREAVRSRGDLVRLNAYMGHAAIIAQTLQRALPGGTVTLADLGSGDGTLMLSMAKSLAGIFPKATVTLVDRQATVEPAVLDGFRRLGWDASAVNADVFEWLTTAPAMDAITANLFLHHFEDKPLAKMFSLVARKTRLFVACETRRSRIRYWSSFGLTLLGAGRVTVNDAPISVRAGFQNGELSRLWPTGAWKLSERAVGLFGHHFIAKAPM